MIPAAFAIEPAVCLVGHTPLPPDKSISHRALMLAACAQGPSALYHVSTGQDVQATRRCLEQLGAVFYGPDAAGCTRAEGAQRKPLTPPGAPLDCGNSGTTMRLLMGLLSGLGLPATLVGDASLMRRPMARIARPLAAMGAQIQLHDQHTAPVQLFTAQRLRGTPYALPLPSGQLKAALLLAGLFADGPTVLTGALGGRDHTERLLTAFGAALRLQVGACTVVGPQPLQPATLHIPQDISAAAFYLAAAALLPHSDVHMTQVGLNPTRLGFVEALATMGAHVEHTVTCALPEPTGTLHLRGGAPLRGITLGGPAIAPLIDELPVLMVLATGAQGTTVVRDAQELRVKESDRIAAMAFNLRQMGAHIETFDDGFRVEGPQKLRGAELKSFGDHRIAMAAAVAALTADGPSRLDDAGCAAVSDPSFFETLSCLRRGGPHPGSSP